MSIGRLHYFLEVAKYLNFLEASKHLYMSQSAISKQISLLEEEIGTQLFFRNKRQVELTPQGLIFYQKVLDITEKYEEAVNITQTIGEGIIGSLKIGVLGYMEFIPPFLKKFKQEYPCIKINLIQLNTGSMIKSILNREIDFGITFSHGLHELPNLIWETLKTDKMIMVVNRDHVLFTQQSLPLSALSEETFIVMSRNEVPEGYNYFIKLFENETFKPKIAHQVDRMETLFLLVESGMGIAIVPNCVNFTGNGNHKTISIAGKKATIDIGIVQHKDNSNPSCTIFLDSFREHSKNNVDFNLIGPGLI